jgi:5-methylcytosine-specific restriction endonuclease McrA
VARTTITLLLNATYEPLCVVSSRRAVVLLLTDKAVAVEAGDGELHAVTCTVPVPSVVRLTRYVRVPFRIQVPLTRKAVFARDGGRCAYCGAVATSIDHVVPRSRGGLHVWENVVASCSRCNHIKADRHVAELGWSLRVVPRAPNGMSWRVIGARSPDPRWSVYLGAGEAAATA